MITWVTFDMCMIIDVIIIIFISIMIISLFDLIHHSDESSDEECTGNLLTRGVKFTSRQDFEAFIKLVVIIFIIIITITILINIVRSLIAIFLITIIICIIEIITIMIIASQASLSLSPARVAALRAAAAVVAGIF